MAYGERGRRRPPVVDLADRRALERYRPADPEVVEEARRLKEAALLDFGLTEPAVASWLYAKCHHQIATTAVDTAAVVASGDGTCLLLYNPDFFVGLGLDGVKFVLFHEARHLVHRHLFTDPELRDDPVFELAAEVSINHVALVRLDREELPLLDGRPTGVDPRRVYDAYREDLTTHGLEPVAYETFTETDMRVYGELRRMHRPPVPERRLCVHVEGGWVPADQETVDAVTSSALLNSLLAARRGHAGAERELLDLMGRTEDGSARAAKIWGNLGAGVLRGRTTRTRTVHWWQRWLVDVLMEVTQEWSLAGRRIENLRAQIAVQNPPYHLGHKLLVSWNNIAQATRFTASPEVQPKDIPANEWLLAHYGADAETVLEWWKHDIDDDGRAWITKRTLERLIKLHRRGLPLGMATVYLGDGEYAPVPLTALIDRLNGRPVTGLRELARDADTWEARLRRAAEHSAEGGDDSDVVHQILANAELSQLKKHRAVVTRLVALLPAKLRATNLVGASAQQQRFWTEVFTGMRRR